MPFGRPVDTRPQAVAAHRRARWPDMIDHPNANDLVPIYNVVRSSGLPNAMSARVPLPSKLNLAAWEFYLGALGDRERVMDFVKFGFPTGYIGPTSHTVDVPNHPSAEDFPTHIDDFVTKELELKGLVGPFSQPPFRQWCHVSPLMSREKGDTGKRRVITDMTYPGESSINAYIVKNGVYGVEEPHSLPTIEALADDIKSMGAGVYMSSLDVSRAYKNFVSDPLDSPLLCFAWKGSYYCDTSMPFGSRASSFHMQSVANCITDVLKLYGIHSRMYLDDLIILSPDREAAHEHFNRARRLLAELGLPEAREKAQPPTRRIKWLGIIVDSTQMTLSIPTDKVTAILRQVEATYHKKQITRKQLQSLLGCLLFVAKCVRPARIFVSRMLAALKATKGDRIEINHQFRADLAWFVQFCAEWNGVGIIPPRAPSRVLLVDACLTGIGGTDGRWAYGQQVAQLDDGAVNITELEAANVVVALHTFLTTQDRGTHIRVRCDNMAAVSVFTTGRAVNEVLQDCARAAWMVQALLGVELSYDHIPGDDNVVADALSRAHTNLKYQNEADSLVAYYGLTPVYPCVYYLHNIGVPMHSRSGATLAPPRGCKETGSGARTRDPRQSQVIGVSLHRVHGGRPIRPPTADNGSTMRLPRIRGRPRPCPRDNTKQNFTCQEVPAFGRLINGPSRSPPDRHGTGRLREGQVAQSKCKAPPANGGHGQGSGVPAGYRSGQGSDSSGPHTVLRRIAPIRGGTNNSPWIRQIPPPVEGRLCGISGLSAPHNKMGEDATEGWTNQSGDPPKGQGLTHVPSSSCAGQHQSGPFTKAVRPTADVPRLPSGDPSVTHQETVGIGTEEGWGRHHKVLVAQPQKICCNTGPCQGLLGRRDPETRGVAVRGIQSLYRHPNWASNSRTRGLSKAMTH